MANRALYDGISPAIFDWSHGVPARSRLFCLVLFQKLEKSVFADPIFPAEPDCYDLLVRDKIPDRFCFELQDLGNLIGCIKAGDGCQPLASLNLNPSSYVSVPWIRSQYALRCIFPISVSAF